jgi:hypothetical protein
LRALEQRGVMLPIRDSLVRVMQINSEIADEFSAAH